MRNLKTCTIAVVALFFLLAFVDSRHAWEWIYTHYLYDYHFGFMKRGFVGEALTFIFGDNQVVPLGAVKAISWTLFGLNTGLALYFFKLIKDRTSEKHQQIGLIGFFAFCLLAPTFLRNFSYDLGRFDQISCLVLMIQWFHPALWVTSLLSIVMVLIHENYLFIFLPAVLFFVYLQKGFRSSAVVAICSVVATLFVMKFGAADTDIETLWAHLLTKANSHLDHNVELLYWTFSDQLTVNKAIRARHVQYIPGFLFYLLWCVPFAFWWKKAKLKHDRLSPLYFFGITLGYIIIFVLSDWCRSINDLFVTLTMLTLYMMKRDDSFRARLLSLPVFKSKLMYAVIALSLVVPATGVDIPRIYKLYDIVVAKISAKV